MSKAGITAEAVNKITAEAVHKVFRDACPRWVPPDDRYCATIALILRSRVEARAAEKKYRDDLEAARKRARQERSRRLRDALASMEILLPASGHTVAAERLVLAMQILVRLPKPPLPRAGIYPPWHAQAFLLEPVVRHALTQANPGRGVGRPWSAEAPVVRVLKKLLNLGGVSVSPAAIGQYFMRRKDLPLDRVAQPKLQSPGSQK